MHILLSLSLILPLRDMIDKSLPAFILHELPPFSAGWNLHPLEY